MGREIMVKWNRNNPDDVTPEDIENMTDEELKQHDKDTNEYYGEK
jgi:hypothetical protein